LRLNFRVGKRATQKSAALDPLWETRRIRLGCHKTENTPARSSLTRYMLREEKTPLIYRVTLGLKNNPS